MQWLHGQPPSSRSSRPLAWMTLKTKKITKTVKKPKKKPMKHWRRLPGAPDVVSQTTDTGSARHPLLEIRPGALGGINRLRVRHHSTQDARCFTQVQVARR